MAENVPTTSLYLGRLCPTCRHLFVTWDEIVEELELHFQFRGPRGQSNGPYGLPFHEDAVAWRTEVENGCVFCMRLFDSLEEKASCKVAQSRRRGEVQIRLNIWSLNGAKREEREKRDYRLWATIRRSGGYVPRSQLDGSVTLVPKSIEAGRELKLAPSTSSDESLAFVKNWIKSCRNDHPECRTNGDFRLPTRLVEINGKDLRIRTPGDMIGMHDYVTLSHCWGTVETLKLMKSNVQALTSTIPLHDLCKTFQDAVLVTSLLGYKYLWIDSMCIIQDDEDDWRKESALMSEVYGNAVVNLAATDAKDGSVGLFHQRVVARITKQYVQTKSLQTYEIPDERLYFRCLDRSLLSRRAWVFQERYLAHRTVHFSAEQIFCECRRHIACEGSPEGASVGADGPDDIPFPRKSNMGDPEEWRNIIQLYSRTRLTYSKDKLVALSGVARQFQSVTGDQYVAGLWRTGLEVYLCWRVERSETLHPLLQPETSAYQAPSWSWASTNQPINWYLHTVPLRNRFDNDNLCGLISFLEIQLVPVGPDPLGQLLAAHLEIDCGPLIRGSVIASLLNGAKVPFDNPHQRNLKSGKPFRMQAEGEVHSDLEVPFETVAESLYLLPISIETSGDLDLHDETWVTMYGLVVTKAGCDGLGVFKRFGAWEINFNVGSYLELIELFLMRPETLMDDTLYKEQFETDEDGIPRYAITLV